jgi:RHH-type proline utilization regulon transcriptional repressor/proline dehydrogenase/delta 1-pyrroline-5-carboxylate dehydrogenase
MEGLTRDYGRDIFARLQRSGPFPFGPAWWDERLMEWTMADEALKVQLFRFVDVLPMLKDPAEIARHLREYFGEVHEHLSGWMRLGLRLMPQRGGLASVVARVAYRSAERLARRFIAGTNLQEVLQAIAQLRRKSLGFTVDLLGEAAITEVESDRYRDEYLHLVEGLGREVNRWDAIDLIDRDEAGPIPRVNVSVKLSSLYSQFDPIDPAGTTRTVLDRLRPILRAARSNRAFVNIDMEQYSYKDLTLRIFRQVFEEEEFRGWTDVGIAIQAYLKSCRHDLEELARWAERRGTPVWVRLVKGAYWDFETVMAQQQDWPIPVFEHKWATDASYEKLTHFLLRNRHVLRPAFGSHNVRSLAHALAAADSFGVPPGAYEFQMLYGMADPIKEVLTGMGHRVRVYTPYGQLLPGMAYLVRRLLENTANESFLRASFTENVPEDRLLMNPESHRLPTQHDHDRSRNSEKTVKAFRNEPVADFSRQEARQAMETALQFVRGQFGLAYPPVIDGKSSTTTGSIDSVDPSRSSQVVGRCGKATVAHAEQAIAVARRAFPDWRDTPAARRAELLSRCATIMRRRRFELSAWEVFECGKPWREADADVAEAIDFCDYYAREMLRLAGPSQLNVRGEENSFLYEPRGVAVIIAPWNFPLAILCGMTAAALVTGNTVIMKPAEQSSVVGAKLMEVLREAGIPAGAASFLPGIGEEIGPTLIQHPDVAIIAFTGSRGVGLLINREAAETPPRQDHVKRVIAEMGGKNAIIIDDDADLDEAVHGVVASAFGYQGQKCSACSRAIVLDGLHDIFLSRLVEATRSLTVAPAADPGCAVGPVIDSEARDRILGYIEKGKAECRLAFAGDVGSLAKEGFYVGPHIFADVAPEAAIAQQEIFGPVLAVMKARDLSHALEIANGTQYALTGGLYSRSPRNIVRVKREFRVGNLYINRKITGALVQRQPFGGFKMSGIGSKAGGPDYLLQFLVPRTITENTMRRGFAPTADAH